MLFFVSLWVFSTLNLFSKDLDLLVLPSQFKRVLTKLDVSNLNITLFFEASNAAMTVTGWFYREVNSYLKSEVMFFVTFCKKKTLSFGIFDIFMVSPNNQFIHSR